ncbi:MAG TPA: PAS domain-containing protein, partial [Puia sp.]|nr:PAS domain-containing protein [Puia sp.]
MRNKDYTYSPQLVEMLNVASIDRIYAIDLAWTIIAWNNTTETITGIKKAEALGKNILDLFPDM